MASQGPEFLQSTKAGIGVFLGLNDPRNVSRRVEGKQTNNTAELQAIIDVFKILEKCQT